MSLHNNIVVAGIPQIILQFADEIQNVTVYEAVLTNMWLVSKYSADSIF